MSNSSGNNTQELPRHDFAASVYNMCLIPLAMPTPTRLFGTSKRHGTGALDPVTGQVRARLTLRRSREVARGAATPACAKTFATCQRQRSRRGLLLLARRAVSSATP